MGDSEREIGQRGTERDWINSKQGREGEGDLKGKKRREI